MVTLSPGFWAKTNEEQMPGFTCIQPFRARSHGGVAIRMFNITMLPSAGWLAMEYARTMGSSLTILRSHNPNLSHSDWKVLGSG